MSDSRIAARYAKALLDLAVEKNALDEVTDNVRNLAEATQNRDLQLLLKSPIVSGEKKQSVLKALFGDYHEITSKFINLVTEKVREADLPDIAQEFLRQYKVLKGISTVKITSATPLGESAIEAIKAKLIAQGLTTSTIELERLLDPSLLGGFVLQVGDKLYDASASAKLNSMRKGFTGNLYQKKLIA